MWSRGERGIPRRSAPGFAWRTQAKQSRRRERYLDFAASFHGLRHREFVGGFEIAADGDAPRDGGDADAERLEELGEVNRGGFAFHIWVRRQDNFLDTV